jgi:hypothetical protein
MVVATAFQLAIDFVQYVVFDFHAVSAGSADQMVMLVPRNLVHETPLCVERWLDHANACKEVKGAIDRRLSKPARIVAGLSIDLRRREMCSRLTKHMQDR